MYTATSIQRKVDERIAELARIDARIKQLESIDFVDMTDAQIDDVLYEKYELIDERHLVAITIP